MGTALRFVSEPLSEAENLSLVATFRAQGWCCLKDVFERDSVAQFRRELLAKLQPSTDGKGRWILPRDAPELVAPVLAPRLRAFIPQLLTPAHPRGEPSLAQLFELAWQAEPGPLEAQGWHRDRSGGAKVSGDVSAPEDDCYRFPEAVHCTAYYRDMDIDAAGPAPGGTEILSGSHLDASCPRPASGVVGGWQSARTDGEELTTQAPTTSFAPRAQDVIVWDQRCVESSGSDVVNSATSCSTVEACLGRCWHRRGPFVPHAKAVDNRRLMSIFGFHQTQMFRGTGYEKPYEMPPALAHAWARASAEGEHEIAGMLGGRWSAESVLRGLEKAKM